MRSLLIHAVLRVTLGLIALSLTLAACSSLYRKEIPCDIEQATANGYLTYEADAEKAKHGDRAAYERMKAHSQIFDGEGGEINYRRMAEAETALGIKR